MRRPFQRPLTAVEMIERSLLPSAKADAPLATAARVLAGVPKPSRFRAAGKGANRDLSKCGRLEDLRRPIR